MNVSVLIPTYRRTQDLEKCLDALKKQLRPADQIIVTVRDTDTETQEFLRRYDSGDLALESVPVKEVGVVAAMNAGLAKVTGDLVALTDDDTTPWEDWLKRIEAHFLTDDKLGGVGGRDWHPTQRWDSPVVGKLRWYGKVVGNHHVGAGPAREVDILKGANCAYRAAPLKKIGFDQRMRGTGAQVHWELSLAFAMKKLGWKLVYDPDIALDHHVGKRFDEDQRHENQWSPKDLKAIENAAFNEAIILLENFGSFRRIVYLIWGAAVGTTAEPGAVQLIRHLAKRNTSVFGRISAVHKGKREALRFLRNR